jgi:hypothetical protein
MSKKKIVVLSGAGISAESGLKTFRDSDGLWEGYDVYEVATPRGWKKDPALVLTADRHSDLSLDNSSKGYPILPAPGLVPGASASGRITVRNTSDQPVLLKLVRRELIDTPGPYGGRLSDALSVQIVLVRGHRKSNKPRTAYAGDVARMRQVRLRKLKPHAKRKYQFVVRMADGGLPPSATTGDNAYQESSASVDFVWRAYPVTRGKH